MSAEGASTNLLVRLPAISDFQRLQYYYAAQPASPAPGTERGIFTLKPDRTWSGDWNSTAVPKPTTRQLQAVTAEQVDLFKRAAVYQDGVWQIATSRTNIPLAQLTLTPELHARLTAIIERDVALKEYQQAEEKLTELSSSTVTSGDMPR
jgi:hypothetical protein